MSVWITLSVPPHTLPKPVLLQRFSETASSRCERTDIPPKGVQMLNSIIYPNPNFTPEIRVINDIEFAHAGKTPFWCAKEGQILLEEHGSFRQPPIYEMKQRPRYNTYTINGVIIGQRYPVVSFHRKRYAVHILMAIAWIGPVPTNFQVDHLNGDIYNWMLENIRIVSIPENYRCAVILRWLRKKGIDPRNLTGLQCRIAFIAIPLWDKERRQSITRDEILHILSSYTIITNPKNLD